MFRHFFVHMLKVNVGPKQYWSPLTIGLIVQCLVKVSHCFLTLYVAQQYKGLTDATITAYLFA